MGIALANDNDEPKGLTFGDVPVGGVFTMKRNGPPWQKAIIRGSCGQSTAFCFISSDLCPFPDDKPIDRILAPGTKLVVKE